MSSRKNIARTTLLATPVAAVAIFAAACGSGGSNGGSAAAPPAASATAGGAAGAAATTVTLQSRTGPLGTFLTDQAGHTLYLWQGDSGGMSNCTGGCAAAWPPLTVPAGGTATASGPVTAGLVGTITRSDGTKQVTYKGQPLYRFVGDKNPGDTNGQGSNEFGAKWFVLTPGGAAITGSAAGTPSSPDDNGGAAGGGGGYGY